MKSLLTPVALAVLGLGGLARGADYPFQPVPFTDVRITGGFWHERQLVSRQVTVPFALQQCEESGRLKNFDLAAEVLRRRADGEREFSIKPPTIYPFDDTDAYKAIEGAAYALSLRRDPELEARLDGWIGRIAAAQEPDGYLYTFRTMHPDSPGHKWVGAKRWEKDPDLSHELYNCGHLYEAGVAYYQATGKRALLDVCLKNAELLWRDFGDGTRRIAPGHQIVEMGLVKLYRVTNDRRWLDLAKVFLEARGPAGNPYSQQHKPVAEQDEAVGHAVRANYMYAGMADVAALAGEARYFAALEKIWRNVVEKKLYLTGGVGARANGEAYGADYELPHTGYNETCAALALMMWAHRMFLMTGDPQYMDVFERTAYNGFISGVSASGDRFFYPNPLAYDGAAKNNHGHAGRAPWFGCACCPPNLMRTLASLTGYFYAVKDDALYVNLFAESEGTVTVKGVPVRIRQETDYPWSGAVRIVVTPERPVAFDLWVRLPGWAAERPVPSDLYAYRASSGSSFRAMPPDGATSRSAQGYHVVRSRWKAGDALTVEFGLPIREVVGHPAVEATRGQVAFERGPVVYCVEAVEQPLPAAWPAQAKTEVMPVRSLGRWPALRVTGADGSSVAAIPYFAWNNRGLAKMTVWLPEATPPPAKTE
ncbi:MAG TPA: beta-L-arabinofuranosidase domain-containing protein [Opitutaceae bacterium]|nr:beta-L-arabinofuranosidase domain-containing protein [Opitutaceae bacterium]